MPKRKRKTHFRKQAGKLSALTYGDEETFQSLNSIVETMTTGFSVTTGGWRSGKWIRHPLAVDCMAFRVYARIDNEDFAIGIRWRDLSEPTMLNADAATNVEPQFVFIFNYTLFNEDKKRHAKGKGRIMLPSDNPHFMMVQASKTLHEPLDIDDDSTNFFVYVMLSVVRDAEIVKALQRKTQRQSSPQVTTQVITKCLWEKRRNTDLVVVSSDGMEINVHRCFIMESSPVLEAMLAHKMRDKQSRWVVKDVSHDVMFQMLQFIYTDAITTADSVVLLQLLGVANRYNLPRLTSAVQDVLIAQMTADRNLGAVVLPIAHNNSLQDLKRAAEEAVMLSMKRDSNFSGCLLLATECHAPRLQRLAAACLMAERHPPSWDMEWTTFSSAYPALATILLNKHMECNAKICTGKICFKEEDQTMDITVIGDLLPEPL